MTASLKQTVEIEGRTLELSNLNKVLYPGGFTKADVLDYYSKISAWMLPHLAHRMLTLKRYPDGVQGFFFYEKRCPSHRPSWVKTTTISSTHGRKDIPYCEIDGKPALLWAANLASLEFHILLSKDNRPECPTSIVFDLDPGLSKNFRDCCSLGLQLRDLLAQIGLKSFSKNSGKKGLHLYIPLNTPVRFEETKTFARKIAMTLQQKYPETITADMKIESRKKRIFIDWSQNDAHKTTVCAYSLRAAEDPSVSTPLTWKEVETFSKGKKGQLFFSPAEVLKRVKRQGDLFEAVLTLKQTLPAA